MMKVQVQDFLEILLTYLIEEYTIKNRDTNKKVIHMNSSVVTIKGQVVIPAKLRHKYGIERGTLLHFYEKEGEIRMTPLTHVSVDKNFGFLRTKGALRKALLHEKRIERER